MAWFLDGYLEWLIIQQLLKEAIGGLPCLKTFVSDSQLLAAAHRLPPTSIARESIGGEEILYSSESVISDQNYEIA